MHLILEVWYYVNSLFPASLSGDPVSLGPLGLWPCGSVLHHSGVSTRGTRGTVQPSATAPVLPDPAPGHQHHHREGLREGCSGGWDFKSLAPGRCGSNSKSIIFKPIMQNNSLVIQCKSALRWMSHKLTNEKSTLVQVMAWCHQAASHYLSQCWLRFMAPYGVTRPQWVNCFILCSSRPFIH